MDNATVRAGTSYRLELQRGAITQTEKATTTKSGSLSAEGGVEGDVEVGWKAVIPMLSAKARAHGALGASKKRNTALSREISTTARLTLVAPAGQDRWVVGCPGRGDPRHENGWLFGDIISATHEDVPTPLCVLSALDQRKAAIVRLVVKADREHFSLTTENSASASIDDLVLRFQEINLQTLSKRLRAERELKSRVAALAATKKTSLPQTREVRSDALELMSLAASFIPVREPNAGGSFDATNRT
jgi:hypothetical protein